MPKCCATRRASYTSSSEQQRPVTCSGMPSCSARRRWFQSCMVSPMTLCPSSRSMAATVEESTPPDIATAMVLGFCMLRADRLRSIHGRQLAQARYRLRYQGECHVDVFRSVLLAQAEAEAGTRSSGSQAHGGQHVGRLNRSRRAGRASGNCQTFKVKRNDHGLALDMLE